MRNMGKLTEYEMPIIEYDKYKVIQDKTYISDFDLLINETLKLEKNM